MRASFSRGLHFHEGINVAAQRAYGMGLLIFALLGKEGSTLWAEAIARHRDGTPARQHSASPRTPDFPNYKVSERHCCVPMPAGLCCTAAAAQMGRGQGDLSTDSLHQVWSEEGGKDAWLERNGLPVSNPCVTKLMRNRVFIW